MTWAWILLGVSAVVVVAGTTTELLQRRRKRAPADVTHPLSPGGASVAGIYNEYAETSYRAPVDRTRLRVGTGGTDDGDAKAQVSNIGVYADSSNVTVGGSVAVEPGELTSAHTLSASGPPAEEDYSRLRKLLDVRS